MIQNSHAINKFLDFAFHIAVIALRHENDIFARYFEKNNKINIYLKEQQLHALVILFLLYFPLH